MGFLKSGQYPLPPFLSPLFAAMFVTIKKLRPFVGQSQRRKIGKEFVLMCENMFLHEAPPISMTYFRLQIGGLEPGALGFWNFWFFWLARGRRLLAPEHHRSEPPGRKSPFGGTGGFSWGGIPFCRAQTWVQLPQSKGS